jgi:Uma2 family endonuclease
MSDKALNTPAKKATFEDYLTTERGASRDTGRIYSNRWHNLLVSNIVIALGTRIRSSGKSEMYINTMRVRLKNGTICFPDVVIAGAEPSFADQNSDILLNPTVVFEIISPGTNSSDKAQKLESFLALDSIKECIMLKEEEMRAEHFAKQNAKQWIYRIYNERDDVVSLESLNTKVSLSEIYAGIKFQAAAIQSGAVN